MQTASRQLDIFYLEKKLVVFWGLLGGASAHCSVFGSSKNEFIITIFEIEVLFSSSLFSLLYSFPQIRMELSGIFKKHPEGQKSRGIQIASRYLDIFYREKKKWYFGGSWWVHLPIVPFSVAQKTSFIKTIFEIMILFFLFSFLGR